MDGYGYKINVDEFFAMVLTITRRGEEERKRKEMK